MQASGDELINMKYRGKGDTREMARHSIAGTWSHSRQCLLGGYRNLNIQHSYGLSARRPSARSAVLSVPLFI